MDKKKLLWYNLAFMAFTGVWSFGNVINGFATYGGVRAVFPWIIILVLYFVPYSLIVGELGSAFPSEGAGVSAWIGKTMGPKLAFFAGWTYWIVHMPYISQKPSKIIVAVGWILFQDNRTQNLPPYLIAVISLAILALAIVLALKGIGFLKKIATVAGMAAFIISILYVVMIFTAKAVNSDAFGNITWSFDTFKPNINPMFFFNLSILVFAVGGCEKVSPYVNQMKKPGRDFPLGMIMLAIMTAVSALLGTVAMGMMFDSNNIPADMMTNGGYYAFQLMGQHFGIGNSLVIVYAACELIAQVTVIIISIDAPLKMLLDNADRKYIPEKLFKKNQNGIYVNGVKMVGVIAGIIIILPVFGVGGMNDLVVWLVKINSVCMPLRYLWVFAAYIALKKIMQRDKMQVEYRFIKNPVLGKIVGGWCFVITAIACLMGMYNEDSTIFIINIVVPIFLIGLGLIMPLIAKKTNKGTGKMIEETEKKAQ